jgi:hypothetical protein
LAPLREFYYLYIASVYTTIELVSTIGYGDITPVSIFNVKLFMVYQLLGVAIFPIVMNKITSIISSYSTITQKKWIDEEMD